MYRLTKTKIVINNCYGGFSISRAAWDLMCELGYEGGFDSCYRDVERHDLRLVQAVETLGKKANGECSDLKVVEVEVGYNIPAYDGMERIEVSGGEFD